MKRPIKQKTDTKTLLITGGRVIDPSSGIDRDMDVLLVDGRVAELAAPGVSAGFAERDPQREGMHRRARLH